MEQITKYFNAEKYESIFFIVAGFCAIVVAYYFIFVLHKPFLNGIAYAILAIAFIQIVVGTTVYIRSPKDIDRVNRLIETDKTKIRSEEIPRMNEVMKNFAIYKYIEIILIFVGICLLLFFKNELLRGIGLGLVIQSAVMLLLDIVAAARGDVYLNFLKNL